MLEVDKMGIRTKNGHKKRIFDKEQLEALKKNTIQSRLKDLNNCKKLISELKKEDTSSMTKLELHHHQKELELQVKKKRILLQRLLNLGYNAGKIGRPKKNDSEKYKNTHTRITCYFTKGNSKILKELKDQGDIENISAFLNELLDAYFSLTTKDGDYNEKEN
jgi:hypothetical protein